MEERWWELPGPGLYIERAAAELRGGKNVLLGLPANVPHGLLGAFRKHLAGDGGGTRQLSVVDVQDCSDQSPVEALYRLFRPGFTRSDRLSARTLAGEVDFQDRLIWLKGLTVESSRSWFGFLVEYSEACRDIDLLSRTLFCLEVVGPAADDAPGPGICLAGIPYQGVTSFLDIYIFSLLVFLEKKLSPLERQLAVAVSANLSLWDPKLVLLLAESGLEAMFRPASLLREALPSAAEGFLGADGSPWSRGRENSVDGDTFIHSSVLAAEGGEDELNTRVWKAEIQVLYPFIEERRREILAILSGDLQVPFTTPSGYRVDDMADLEIGHIAQQLHILKRPLARDFRNLTLKLKTIRNELAHLRPVSPRIITSREITAYRAILDNEGTYAGRS